MMNHSVILVGAAIAAYIFHCVVCEIEVKSNKLSPWEVQFENGIDPSLYNNDPLYQYGVEYRRILGDNGRILRDNEKYKATDRELDELVEQRLKYLRNAPKVTKTAHTVKPDFDEDYYDEQICGIMHRSSYTYEDDFEKRIKIITDGIAPMGCFYKDSKKEELTCNDSNMRKVPILPKFLKKLFVTGTKIKEVNRTNFGDVSINNIQLVQNEITEIQPWAFSNVKDIGTLEIMDNSLGYLAFDIYYGLKDVHALHLDGNRISFQIYENCSARNISDIPDVLPKLRVLTLARNPLKIIPAQMWAGLRNSELMMLDINRCGLQFIHEDAFTFLPNLKVLYMGGNPSLMPNLDVAMKGLRNGTLESLSLSNNGLHRFPTDAISPVADTLLSLDLSGNPIAYLGIEDLPPNLTKLRTLNLAKCSLMDIAPGTLDLLPDLQNIDLGFNYLKQLPTMTTLSRLTYLNIVDNIIVPDHEDDNGGEERRFILPDYGFANTTSLIQLILTNTNVKKISKHSLTGLGKLQYLLMENTKLFSIENEAFTGLDSLRSLKLSNNKNLTSLNSMTFYGLTKLTFLYMDNCGITFPSFPRDEIESDDEDDENETKPLYPDPFRPFLFLESLEILEFSNNNITELYPELFKSNMRITQLLFDGNHIKSWNITLLAKNYKKRRATITDNEEEKHTMFILSTNQLNFITEAMIADIISFQAYIVDLSTNTFVCDMGACALRDLMIPTDNEEFLPFSDVDFTNMESYSCVDPHSDELIQILNVTDVMCKSFNQETIDNMTVSSNWTTIIVASTTSFAFIIAIAVVGYKQREHIRYWIFRAQLNISIPRAAKTSLAELIQYDFDIFVSYHNEDRDFIVGKFLPEVEDPTFRKEVNTKDVSGIGVVQIDSNKSTGFRVFLHERDFEAGMPITENILDAVDRSKKVVVVVSKKYLESQWCTFEMNLAYHRLVENRRKAFVVIILEAIPTNLRTKVLNYLMRSRTYLEWPGDNASAQDLQMFWNRLRNSFMATE